MLGSCRTVVGQATRVDPLLKTLAPRGERARSGAADTMPTGKRTHNCYHRPDHNVANRDDKSGVVNNHPKTSDTSPGERDDVIVDDDNGDENLRHHDQHVENDSLSLRKWTRRECKLFVRRFLRSFGKAAAVYAGVRTFTALMKNPFRKGMPGMWQGVLSKDCLRFATFLGLYPSLYHLTISVLRRYRKQQDGWNYGLAGGIAGLSMALEAQSRQKTLAFFVTARALGAGATTLVARGVVSSVPHSETWAFCACCAVLVLCVALYPALLPAGYYHSVLKWSRDFSDPVLNRLFREPGNHFLTCQEVGLHRGPCTRHALEDLVRSLPVFAQLYLPIHLAPVFLFKRQMLKTRPKYVLLSLAKNLTYSTLFLATMVFIAKYVICLLRNGLGKPPPLPAFIPAVAGFLCGFSVLWERVGRRKELVLFLIPQLLNALLVLAKSRSLATGGHGGRRSRVPQGYVVLFALAMGVVMHAYEREPPSLTMLMNGVLKFFVGGRHDEGTKGGRE